MKMLFLASLIFTLPMVAKADSDAIQSVRALGLHEFYCDVDGKTQGGDSFHYTSTISIFASDEAEAIKICLNKVDAMSYGERGGKLVLLARDKSISSEAMFVNKISVRKGQMK